MDKWLCTVLTRFSLSAYVLSGCVWVDQLVWHMLSETSLISSSDDEPDVKPLLLYYYYYFCLYHLINLCLYSLFYLISMTTVLF